MGYMRIKWKPRQEREIETNRETLLTGLLPAFFLT